MRISSLFLTSLIVFNFSSISAQSTMPKGYAKDGYGRTLVYRAQSSLWSGIGGFCLGGIGSLMTYGAWHEQHPRVTLSGSFRLSDFLSEESLENLPNFLARMHINIPFPAITGKPARTFKCLLGTGVTLSGAAIFYSWISNYVKLSTPLIVIDRDGLQYEGKDKIYWKNVKSVHVVNDASFNWHNGTGKFKEKYALEIIDAYDRFLIQGSDIAITADELYSLIKHYHKKWW